MHVGISYEEDIAGACEQGWEAACIKPKQSDWESKDVRFLFVFPPVADKQTFHIVDRGRVRLMVSRNRVDRHTSSSNRYGMWM